MRQLSLAPWLAKRAALEYAEHQYALQPVPQPGFVARDHRNGTGFGGDCALHQLPHLHSWVEHQRGVPAIGDMELSRALHAHWAVRPGSPGEFARGFKVSRQASFSSEASYEDDRLAF